MLPTRGNAQLSDTIEMQARHSPAVLGHMILKLSHTHDGRDRNNTLNTLLRYMVNSAPKPLQRSSYY